MIATATCGFTPCVGALLHSETTGSSRIGVRRAEGLHIRSKFKRILAVTGLTGLLAVPAGAAWAEPPVTLDPVTKIVDSAGVLGGDKAEVESAIKKLGTDESVVLHVVTVKKFEDPTDREAWTDAVAEKASLGSNALIFAIATDTRQYVLNKGGSKITNAQIENIKSKAIGPQLANGDYAQAAINAAAAIGDAAGGGSGNVPGDGAGAAVLVGTGVVAAGGAGAYLYFRNKRKKA
ncbi:MAG: peptidase, partial [Pseudarthrobacter sp.]|nr:peptidase [Pseudarthrobacter sp.]